MIISIINKIKDIIYIYKNRKIIVPVDYDFYDLLIYFSDLESE